jgi:hypothetical protein
MPLLPLSRKAAMTLARLVADVRRIAPEYDWRVSGFSTITLHAERPGFQYSSVVDPNALYDAAAVVAHIRSKDAGGSAKGNNDAT